MRKPRDYDAEMKALADKARDLKTRKQSQLGELVIACGADAIPMEELAGALLAAVAMTDTATKEGWRKQGAAFFQGSRIKTGSGARPHPRGVASGHGGKAPSPPEAQLFR
jgi:hypothetical protein